MPKEVTIHRYEPGHGKGGEYMGMEETPTGHWCAWDDVQAEVARLLVAERAAHAATKAELRDAEMLVADKERLLRNEERAHETTKAELQQARDYAVSCSTQSQEDSARREAAEQRVAELEHDRRSIDLHSLGLIRSLDECRSALSSARALLERIVKYAREDRAATPGVTRLARVLADSEHWLAAHPESATPAEQRREGAGDVSDEREWFCPQCGLRRLGVSYDGGQLDEDGCCALCGATCCRMSELRALLSRAGWVFDDESHAFWRLANFLDPADKGFGITVERMRELLATRGLAIVPDADVVTPEERAVLEACEALAISTDAVGPLHLQGQPQIVRGTQAVAEAEFARRAAKEANRG